MHASEEMQISGTRNLTVRRTNAARGMPMKRRRASRRWRLLLTTTRRRRSILLGGHMARGSQQRESVPQRTPTSAVRRRQNS